MFRNAGSFVFRKQFKKIAKENENLKNLCISSKSDKSSKSFVSNKIKPFCEKRLFYNAVHYRFPKNNNYVKPVILLSGVLTFLGLKQKSPEEKESELIMAMKRGILYTKREQYDKAEQVLHFALKLAQDQKDEDAITYVHDLLANVAFQSQQFEKAEKLFVSVLQRLFQKGETEDSNRVIDISLKIAKIYESLKNYKTAELGYKFCIEALDKKLQTDDEDTLALWGMSMDWYGRFLLGVNRKSEALDCFKKAYDMCVKVNGQEHEQSVVLLNDLGTISSLLGDTESAMAYFQEAKTIGDKLPGMRDLAAIYINIGQLYFSREMYNESKLACEEGLRKAVSFDDTIACSEAKQCLENISKAMQAGGKNVKNNKQTG